MTPKKPKNWKALALEIQKRMDAATIGLSARREAIQALEKRLELAGQVLRDRPNKIVEKEVLPLGIFVALAIVWGGWVVVSCWVLFIDLPDVRHYKVPTEHVRIIKQLDPGVCVCGDTLDLIHKIDRLRRRLHECVSQ
jgi:hypothetical protein